MNRRNFLGMLVGGIAASAAVRTWPFRVYSFPSEPIEAYALITLTPLYRTLGIAYHRADSSLGTWAGLDRSSYPAALADLRVWIA